MVYSALSYVLEYQSTCRCANATPLRRSVSAVQPIHIVNRSSAECVIHIVSLPAALTLSAELLLRWRLAVVVIMDAVDAGRICYLSSDTTDFARSNYLRCVAEATLLNAVRGGIRELAHGRSSSTRATRNITARGLGRRKVGTWVPTWWPREI